MSRYCHLLSALFSLTVWATSAHSTDTPNLSNRYANAYQAYLDAGCPLPVDEVRHFVYLARDRERLRDHAMLQHPRFSGAQVMYAWAELEPVQDKYDFSSIEADYQYLHAHGKQLFVQLQDATFNPQYKAVPNYLLNDTYDGGAIMQIDDNGAAEGWVAKRWNPQVRERFALLIKALGQAFDGRIAGINLQETAIGVDQSRDDSFTPALYAEAIQSSMNALKAGFTNSVAMQYANFMPGEWLPWDDQGYLRSVYRHGNAIGVGLGAPDLMVRKKAQLNHTIRMMHEDDYQVPLGIAIQDGNYIGETNSDKVLHQRDNIVPLLHAFASDFMKVDYMFWVDQEPYFSSDVLSCLSSADRQQTQH